MRRTASALAYGALVGSGTARVFRHLNQGNVPILMYHGLHGGEADPVVNYDGMSIHVDRFTRQMRYLARHYAVVPLGRHDAPAAGRRRIVVTFDDGYASVYRYAYPVMKSLGLPATVFVSTEFVTRRSLMWWDRLRLAIRATRVTPAAQIATLETLHASLRPARARERDRILDDLDGGTPAGGAREPYDPLTLEQMRAMADGGVSFQSHGLSHVTFGALSSDEIAAEITESKATLEDWLRRPVTWFAYPFGDRDVRAAAVLARACYDGAVTCRESLSRPGDGPFALPRVAVGDRTSFPQFIAAISGVRDLTARVKRAIHVEPVA